MFFLGEPILGAAKRTGTPCLDIHRGPDGALGGGKYQHFSLCKARAVLHFFDLNIERGERHAFGKGLDPQSYHSTWSALTSA
jgi:hypothetical protein